MANHHIELSPKAREKVLAVTDRALLPVQDLLRNGKPLSARVVRSLADENIISMNDLPPVDVFAVKSMRRVVLMSAGPIAGNRVRIPKELQRRLSLYPDIAAVAEACKVESRTLYHIVNGAQAGMTRKVFKAINEFFSDLDGDGFPLKSVPLKVDEKELARPTPVEAAPSLPTLEELWEDPDAQPPAGRDQLLARLIGLVEKNHSLVERKVQLVEKTLELVDQVNLTLSENNAIFNRLADLLADSGVK